MAGKYLIMFVNFYVIFHLESGFIQKGKAVSTHTVGVSMVTSSDNKIFYCSYVVLLIHISQVCFQVPHVEGRSFMPEKGISTTDIEQPVYHFSRPTLQELS